MNCARLFSLGEMKTAPGWALAPFSLPALDCSFYLRRESEQYFPPWGGGGEIGSVIPPRYHHGREARGSPLLLLCEIGSSVIGSETLISPISISSINYHYLLFHLEAFGERYLLSFLGKKREPNNKKN